MSKKETLQEKLLNYYPAFLTRLPDTIQYKFIRTIRNSLLPIQTTLKILDLQENLDRPIQIWKEQKEPYKYDLHFQVNIDNISQIEIYKQNTETEEDELITLNDGTSARFTYSIEEEKNQFYYILQDITSIKPISDDKYYIHITTHDEYEFYKGYPENDYPITDYLTITENTNPDGTYYLEFKTQNINNIYEFKIETYTPNENKNQYTLTETLTANYNNNWNNNEDYLTKIDKYLTDNPTATYEEAKQATTPFFQNNWIEKYNTLLESELTENKYIFTIYTDKKATNTQETLDNNTYTPTEPETYQLILERNHLQEDIYDHDYALDIIGKRLDFPRSKFTPFDGDVNSEEYIEFYKNTEPAYNNKYTEDDYHYANRMKFYCENLQAHINDPTIGEDVKTFTPHRKNTEIIAPLELPQLEIYKHYGLIPEMVNRHKYLVRQNKDNMRGILCGPGDEGIKIPTIINLTRKPSFVVGKQTRIYATVFEEETQEPVNKGNVVFKITQKNGEVISSGKVSINNYQATYTITPKYTGDITIELIYQGTSKYKRCKNILTYTVSKVPTRIYAENIRTIWNNTFNLSAHVVSSRNPQETITGNINFQIKDIDTTANPAPLSLKSYINEATYTHPAIIGENETNNGTRIYTVTARYDGDETFEKSETTFILRVTDEPSTAYIHSLFVPPKHIACKLYGYNEDTKSLTPLTGKQIELRWHNIYYDTITTDKFYVPFSRSAKIPENLGDLKLIFPNDDDEYYGTSYNIPPFEPLTLEDTEILIPSESNILLGQNNILSATLLSKQGFPLADKKLQWKIGTEDFGEFTTDENGVCMVNYTPTTGGDYTLTVSYEGEELRYYPTNSTGELHVLSDLDTYLSVNTTTVYVNGSLIVTLKDENGNPCAYQTVQLKNTTSTDGNYGAIFATGITDSNGQANIPFNMSPRQNKSIQVVFNGDEYGLYNPSTLDLTNFTVRKRPINMTTTPARNGILIYGDNNTIKTTLIDGDTFTPLTGFDVYWHITRTSTGENKRYGPVATNSNGISECPINLGQGEYNYGVIVPETDYYTGKDTYTNSDYRVPFSITNTSTGTSKPVDFEIVSTPRSIATGEAYNVTAKVTGENLVAPTGSVTVYIGSYDANTKKVTGSQGQINLSQVSAGVSQGTITLASSSTMNPTINIPIKGLYAGDTHYQVTSSEEYSNGISYIDVTANTTPTTGKKDLTEFKVNITEDTAYPDDKYHINVNIKGDGVTSPTGTVIFYINQNHTGKQGETNLTTKTNGNSTITSYERTINTTTARTYTIYAYYTGDDNYNVADSFNYTGGSDTITVLSKSSSSTGTTKQNPNLTLSVSPNPVPKGEDYTVKATVTKGATGTIIFSKDGTKIDTVTINTNGLAVLSLNANDLNPTGTFTAEYAGDTNYQSATATTTATITNSTGKTTYLSIPTTMTKGEKFTVTLTDNNNQPVAGATVTLTLTGNGATKTYALQPTTYEGKASLEINLNWATGTIITVVGNFNGYGNYNPCLNVEQNVTYYNS